MCLDDPILIKLIARELPEAQRASAEAHLAGCPLCQARYQELHATWDVLGDWQAPDPASSLVPAILKSAHRPTATWSPMRLAAAITLAAGTGALVALQLPRNAPIGTPVSAVAPEQVVQALGLDALGSTPSLDQVFIDAAREDL